MSDSVSDLVSEFKSFPGLKCPDVPLKVFATELVVSGQDKILVRLFQHNGKVVLQRTVLPEAREEQEEQEEEEEEAAAEKEEPPAPPEPPAAAPAKCKGQAKKAKRAAPEAEAPQEAAGAKKAK